MLPKGYLAVSAVSLLLLGWLYGGDVSDALAARNAEVAAFAEPPSLGFALLVLAATLAGAVATIYGAVKKKTGSWRGYRLMPIIVVLVLFVDLVFLSASRSPLGSADRSFSTLTLLTNQANLAATATRVPRGDELQPLMQPLDPPAYLVKGERPKSWRLVERQNCSGPADDAKGEPLGTVIYCTAADGKQAWFSLVALPVEVRFGSPKVMTRGGTVMAGLVTTHAEPGPEDADEEPSSDGLKMVPDGGP
ncbi:MAG: hypothetical protein QM723_16260 [Myxococcaceae bacterium]